MKVKMSECGNYADFVCPGCMKTHVLSVKGPYAWQFNFNIDEPTFKPSILARRHRGEKCIGVCHSYVTDGKIQFLGDCTHDSKNKTIDLPEYGTIEDSFFSATE